MKMWLFGYGSLIWKVDFPVKSKMIGYVKGYLRRFYQASIDHRGVPEKPGRVVTLLPTSSQDDVVWGVAYEIAEENIERVLQHLDYREKNGYERSTVKFYPKDNPDEPFDLFLYIATRDNTSYLGEAKIEDIAKQISESSGPSGSNSEYLFQLATAMRNLAPECNDTHLYDLEAAVKKIISKSPFSVSHG